MSKSRIGILFWGIGLVFCALAVRLFHLQVVKDDALPPLALVEERTVVLPGARGAILDRDGNVLRATKDAYDVHVVASTFREKNVVDALGDLMLLLREERLGPLGRPGFTQRLRGAASRAAIEEVLALDARHAIDEDADDLHGRARVLIEPEGTLVRGTTYARRRVIDALAVVAQGCGPTPRDIRKRLKAGPATVGRITSATADFLVDRVRGEEERLEQLGGELAIGGGTEMRAALDGLCDRHFRRVEAEVERRIDDAICLQHFGSWDLDLARLGPEGAAKLRARASAAISNDTRVRKAVEDARGVAPGDWDRTAIRTALCAEIRNDAKFDRARYLDARKEGQTRNDLCAFRGDELGVGGSVAVLDIIEGPGGLRELGFSVVPSFVRDDTRREQGESLALLIGEVNRRGNPSSGGAEQRLEDLLQGCAGEARVAGDGAVLEVRPARHGASPRLTISIPLQQRIEELLEQMGAIAVVDVRTGGVLATTTWPRPHAGEERAAFVELLGLQDRKHDLRERIAAGDTDLKPVLAAVSEKITLTNGIHRGVTSVNNVPPGSVMKALTLLVGLESGAIHPGFEIDCGSTSDRSHFRCHHHGRIDLEGALEQSCNEYCYLTVGLLGGSVPLCALFERIGLFDAVPGLIPSGDGAYMRKQIQSDDPRGLAIGQGSLSLPPVRLAGIAASLATGRVVHPHLFAPEGFEAVGGPFAREENLAVIRSGMRRVVVGPHGTAKKSRHRLEPLGVAGKTGTAKVREGDDEINHAWFVGFAPVSGPRYAFAVLLERTPEEGADAAPIAARVVEACYDVLGRGM